MKIAVIGPKNSGKTQIANNVAGMMIDGKTEPTAGCRILTFEREINAVSREGRGQQQTLAEVELWDCSGDQNYEGCWPAIMKDLYGIVVVFDPTSKAQANDVRIWCEWFCKHANLEDRQAVIFAHGNLKARHQPLIIRLDDRQVTIPIVNVNLKTADQDDDDAVREKTSTEKEFLKFLGGCYGFHPDADI